LRIGTHGMAGSLFCPIRLCKLIQIRRWIY